MVSVCQSVCHTLVTVHYIAGCNDCGLYTQSLLRLRSSFLRLVWGLVWKKQRLCAFVNSPFRQGELFTFICTFAVNFRRTLSCLVYLQRIRIALCQTLVLN